MQHHRSTNHPAVSEIVDLDGGVLIPGLVRLFLNFTFPIQAIFSALMEGSSTCSLPHAWLFCSIWEVC